MRGRDDGGEGRKEVAPVHTDQTRIQQQLLLAVVDLGVAPPEGLQGRLRAQRLAKEVSYLINALECSSMVFLKEMLVTQPSFWLNHCRDEAKNQMTPGGQLIDSAFVEGSTSSLLSCLLLLPSSTARGTRCTFRSILTTKDIFLAALSTS